MEPSAETPEWIPGPAWRAAEEYRIDMSLVTDSLERPVWDRMLQHDAAFETLLMLEEAYNQQYGGVSGNS